MRKREKLRALLADSRGESAAGFLFTSALSVLLFATLLSAMIYVIVYYNTGYACRRIVRSVETSGVYDESYASGVLGELENGELQDLSAHVEAPFLDGNHIQLRDRFSVTVRGVYRVRILLLGEEDVSVSLPVEVRMDGMSEVFYK